MAAPLAPILPCNLWLVRIPRWPRVGHQPISIAPKSLTPRQGLTPLAKEWWSSPYHLCRPTTIYLKLSIFSSSWGLGAKRSLAMRELVVGREGLERYVAHELLRRVHEYVFAVPALESEPVDPRL
ncbi:MAG: hypothetical protein R3D67_16500 [Hyphomicrobiaceae bacterium]